MAVVGGQNWAFNLALQEVRTVADAMELQARLHQRVEQLHAAENATATTEENAPTTGEHAPGE